MVSFVVTPMLTTQRNEQTADHTADNFPRAPLRLEWHGGDARANVMALWKSLEHQLAPVAVTCAAAWTEGWLKHFGDLVPHRFGVAWRGTEPRSVFLLAQDLADRRSWLPRRTWHMGTAGEPDRDSVCVEYNDWLCVPEDRDAVLSAILTSHDPCITGDRLMLDGFAAVDLPDTVTTERGWRLVRKVANYCDLRTTREKGQELVTVFGDSTRKGIRQNLRDSGPTEVEWAETPHVAHALFDELIELHQERWTAVGQPGCYSSERFTAFHRDLIDRLVPTGQMTVVRVKAGGVTLGCSQVILDRNRVLVYQGGRIAHSGKKSPGLITDYLCMQESLRRGYDAYDFMAGDSIHKQRLSTHTMPLVWAEYRWPGWRLPLYDALRSTKQTLTKWWSRATPTTAETTSAKER